LAAAAAFALAIFISSAFLAAFNSVATVFSAFLLLTADI